MVYLLKMVIFHGKLLKYQMVTLVFLMFDVQNTQGETLRFWHGGPSPIGCLDADTVSYLLMVEF